MHTFQPADGSVPSGRRPAATWVAATGAFLLVAAAAAFIAGRWGQLPESAKLALVGSLTGAFLVGGRALRPSLPATGDVLFHLGAFLIPIDVAGLGVRLGWTWPTHLLAQGLALAVGLGALALGTRSPTLQRAAAVGALVLAGGVAAVSPVPAPLMVAGAAALLSVLRPNAVATFWAAAAGLSPAGVAVALALSHSGVMGSGVLADLGLAGDGAITSVLTGTLAAAVLAVDARRRLDLGAATLAIASFVMGAAGSWAVADLPRRADQLALPALFLLVEIGAMVARRDPFYGRIATPAALAAELCAAPVAIAAAAVVPFTGFFGQRVDLTFAAALALLAMGWLVADARRVEGRPLSIDLGLLLGSGNGACALALIACTAGAISAATSSPEVTGATLVGIGALVVLSGRRWSGSVAAVLVVLGPAMASNTPSTGAAAALVGALVIAYAATLHSGEAAPVLAGIAALDVLFAAHWARDVVPTPWVAVGAIALLWGLALWLDGVASPDGRASGSEWTGHVIRVAIPLQVLAFVGVSDPATGLAAALASVAFIVDAARRGDGDLLWGAVATIPLLIWAGGRLSQLDTAEFGLALSLAAVVWSGLAAVVDADWRRPLLGGATASLGMGLVLSSLDPAAFDVSLLVTAGIAVGASVVLRQPWLGHLGGGLATVAIFHRLSIVGVTDSEPFLAPVALHLLVAGVLARRQAPISSWVAFAPPIALLGGAALAERWSGGPSHHALIAGAVAVIAVAGGGWFRQSGPLFVGTALLLGLIGHEALAFTANLPTSAWLAAGGTALLITGVVLERSDTSPVEAGRRLVDLIDEHFE